MSDTTVELTQMSIEELREKATELGVQFHPNTGEDKLMSKIMLAIEASKRKPKVKKKETKAELHARLRREANELVRVRITCMNANKKNWPGEIISVGNSVIGSIKKFIPFNNETPYHIPRLILDHLKERNCQIFIHRKDSKGRDRVKSKLVKEFGIEELPPLTKKELKELAAQQAMRNQEDED